MNDETPAPPWLDELEPHEPEHGAAQIAGLLERLGPSPCRVLDLGCGAGRAAVPLARAGHDVVAVDHDPTALARCRDAAPALMLVAADFRAPWTFPDDGYDAVLCLGNTLMTLCDVDDAVAFLRRAAGALAPEGRLYIDDLPHDFWPELTGGGWQSGLSPDGDLQLVWDPGDAVFALRTGDAIDVDRWAPGPGDRRFRLWTDGALRLAATAAGLSVPVRDADAHLLSMARA